MAERYKNQLLPYIARKQKLYLCNIRHIFLYPAIFDNLPPYSPRSTVPVSGAQTGTVAPNTIPVLGTKTGTVESTNPLCHKTSPSPNIDKDKYFHSVNYSQYDSIRTDISSKNGSIHNPTDYRIF